MFLFFSGIISHVYLKMTDTFHTCRPWKRRWLFERRWLLLLCWIHVCSCMYVLYTVFWQWIWNTWQTTIIYWNRL